MVKYSPVALRLRQLADGGGRAIYIMYFVYSIFNKKHNKIYIGQTINLKERLRLHNEKGFSKSYTSRFDGEWVLIYSEETENRAASLKREKQLKSFQGRQFIKKYIPR
ncbi:MAG: GIY-YIG catalytic domain protein [Parcubacteria group bacterium GW2011_GWA2_33_14]|nr:MAG: GIY-YIG catalytic domain protein [Parcubacteria group bacterium GW2011_GWA2_33_14]